MGTFEPRQISPDTQTSPEQWKTSTVTPSHVGATGFPHPGTQTHSSKSHVCAHTLRDLKRFYPSAGKTHSVAIDHQVQAAPGQGRGRLGSTKESDCLPLGWVGAVRQLRTKEELDPHHGISVWPGLASGPIPGPPSSPALVQPCSGPPSGSLHPPREVFGGE